MARYQVNAPGIVAASNTRRWKATAETADYRFGDLLLEVSGGWRNTSQETALVNVPAIANRLPEEVFDSAVMAAPLVWVCYADGSSAEAREMRWRDSLGIEHLAYVAGSTVIDATAANVMAIEEFHPQQISLASREIILWDDTAEIDLASLPGGIPVEAASAYVQVNGYARMTSADTNVFPLAREELFGFYVFPTRDTLVNSRFRLPTAAEYAANPTAQLVNASDQIPWSYAAPAGSLAAAQATLATGRLDGLSILTVTYSNRQLDNFQILSETSQSIFDAALIGEQVARLTGTSPPVIGTQSLKPVQAAITAAVTMPAVGAQVDITVEPQAGLDGVAIATSTSYQAGDLIQLSQYSTDYFTEREAYFTVVSVAGNVITAEALDRSGDTLVAATGATFAVGRSEVTGQTRLSPPVGATQADVFVNDGQGFVEALLDSSNARNYIAGIIAQRIPLVRQAQGDVDPSRRPGISFTDGGQINLATAADIAASRFWGAVEQQLTGIIYVEYR